MRISFDFSTSKRGAYLSLREDYVQRISHFAKISKAKTSDFEIVFVVGKKHGAERIGSEALARKVGQALVQGATGLYVRIDCGQSSNVSRLAGESDRNRHGKNNVANLAVDAEDTSLRVLLVEEAIPCELAEVLAAEQVYRLLMIRSGRSYHK